MPEPQYPGGFVAFTTWGLLTMDTTSSLLEMRGYCERQAIGALWRPVPGALVDRARNAAVKDMMAVQPNLDWLLFVDGDCVFQPDALHKLLIFAYQQMPSCDIVGAYNPLRNPPFLPTIDTGTGTWESHLPGIGPVEVMRTGSAFILIKRRVFEGMSQPWYGTRNPMRPIDAMTDVDNWALQRFDGKNPLREHPAWDVLWKCATEDPATFRRPDPGAFVGEDSNFTDRARAAGFSVWVETNVECGHVDKRIVTAADHRIEMAKIARNRQVACGVR